MSLAILVVVSQGCLCRRIDIVGHGLVPDIYLIRT